MTGIGECLFGDDRDDDEHNDDNKTTMRRMGRGCMGEWTMGGNPTTTVAVVNKDNCRHGGGASFPPLSGPSHPAGCRLLSLMSPITVDGGSTRAFGAWPYAWWRRRRSTPLYSFVRF
jgi:hypothetical protein